MERELKIGILRIFIQAIPDDERTPEKIREVVAEQSSVNNLQFDEVQIEEIARIFEVQFNVALDVGHVVKKNNSEPWWRGRVEDGLDTHYSSRFRTYLLLGEETQLPKTVVTKTDEITDEITDLLGDPKLDGPWGRRGMVIGHVQSGKTLNYSSLITKAADAGYRVIVLLAGITNSLRKQTQDRIDHYFIGQQSTEANIIAEVIGAAQHTIDERVRHPNYLTALERDFSLNGALATRGIQIGTSTEPVIFVCKKNVSTLKNLHKFFKNTKGQGVLNQPFLMIDDEADNASINTLLSQNSVTAINQRLRKILSLFNRSSYVGYTATPFANIFIDPDSVDKMGNDDLFPTDYIKTLDAPTNYVGPNEVFGENGRLKDTMVKTPDDYTAVLDPKHKSNWILSDLPNSLRNAILVFVLAKAVRVHRGQHKKHCTMMVNISRFNNVQSQAYELIENYLDIVREDINSNSKKSIYPTSSVLNELQSIYDQEFIEKANNTNIQQYPEWSELDFFKAVRFMKVALVNMTAGQLDYEKEKKDGLTVIAIGGLALSRGLTLEGLTVSYIIRNASAYDTLMQMGRWFGYRDGYEDLCRLYIQKTSQTHYKQTTKAIAELREELARMQDLGKTPREFGLKVLSHPQSLAITALNKMRTATKVTHFEGLGGESEEVFAVYADNDKNRSNRNLTKDFINNLGEVGKEDPEIKRPRLFWNDVPKEKILDFVEKFQKPSICRNFDYVQDLGSSVFAKFVNSYGEILSNWQVAIANDDEGHTEDSDALLPGKKLKKLFRNSGKLKLISEGKVFYFTQNRMMQTPVHASFGLSNGDIKFLADNPEFNEKGEPKQISAKRYNSIRKQPLLLIYELHCKTDKVETVFDEPAIAFVAHFPDHSDFEVEKVEYAINKVAQQLELPGFGADGQPEDDELLDNDSDEARDFAALQEVG